MITLSQRFTDAVDYARVAHAGQVRKGSGTPYLYHLLAVSSLVLEYGGDEDQAIAGLLHDVIEDCGAQHDPILLAKFGESVIEIVRDCTDGTEESKKQATSPEEKQADWWTRKLKYLEHLRKEPDRSLLVSGCDKLHNARAIVEDLQNPDVGIAVFDRFTAGRQATLRYYESISRVLAGRQMPMGPSFDRLVDLMHQLAGESTRLPLEHEVYHLKIYDNHHYMDEDETYLRGPFFGAENALAAARAIVNASLGGRGSKALEEYRAFGQDPVIIGSPNIEFSAWGYAESQCQAS